MDPEMQKMLAEYTALRQQAMQEKQSSGMMNQPSDHSAISDFGRGAMSGLANSGYNTVGTVGDLLTKFGADQVGPAISHFADQGKLEAQDFYDPHGTAGRIGQGTGLAVGTGAQFVEGGEAMGGEKFAAKYAAKAPRLLGNSFAKGAMSALPASAIHAAATSYSDPTGTKSFLGTLASDEAAAGTAGFVRGALGRLGRIGSKLIGHGTAAPAPEAALPAGETQVPTEAPTPTPVEPPAPAPGGPAPEAPPAAPTEPDVATRLQDQLNQAQSPAKRARAAARPKTTPTRPSTDVNESLKTALDAAKAKPTPEPAAPEVSPETPLKAPAKAKAAAPAKAKAAPRAEATAPTPDAAPETGSQKGGKAKAGAKAADSKSGTGKKGKASAVAKAAAPTASAAPEWTSEDAAKLASHEQYLPTARRLREGLTDKTRADKNIARTEADIATLLAKRKAAGK